MKKIGKIIGIILIFFLFISDIWARPFIPSGASWRLYPFYGEPPSSRGHWIIISVNKDEKGDYLWGENQCSSGPPFECHLWDWITWWFPIVTPEPPKPPGNYGDPLDLPCIPEGYDPVNGVYICEE